MLSYDDHIAVAVSGGKDSLTLLNILLKLENNFPRSKITAICVDEGIEGYRDEALAIASRECQRLRVAQIVVSYQDLFGTTTDEIVGHDLGKSPCSYCGVLRRKAINKAAASIGATKIATGHNLDDEAQTILLNMLHGDPLRILRSGPVLRDMRGKFLPRIKPLFQIPEKEIVLYAHLSGLEFQSISCPHGSTAVRNDLRTFLNKMDQKHPGSKFTLIRSSEKLKELAGSITPVDLNACRRCGDPTPHESCEACLMIETIIA